MQDSVLDSTRSKAFTDLSQPISHRYKGKNCRIVSLPVGMELVGDEIVLTEQVPTIAVVDEFCARTEKIGAGIKVAHGDIVTRYAVNGLEDKIGVLAIDITPPDSEITIWMAIRDALDSLVKIQKKHHNIKALNLSVGVETEYEWFSDLFGKCISIEKLQEHSEREELKKFLSKQNPAKRYRLAYEMIQSINKLVNMGVEVYSASGNAGSKGFDLLSLSKAQNIVSAYDYYDATNFLSTRKGKGYHTFYRQFDDKGCLVKVTDGIIEFSPEEVPPEVRKKSLRDLVRKKEHTIKGTSFSCPLVLNEDLKAKFSVGSEEVSAQR